jgi:cytosine deaminase
MLLQARSPIEAIRLRANRLWVMRRGRVIARNAPVDTTLTLPGRPAHTDCTLQRP